MSNIQISRPVDEVFRELDIDVSFQQNMEEQLVSTMARIPQIQHYSNIILDLHSGNRDKLVEQLFYDADSLDRELSDWTQGVNNSWSISAATNLNLLSSSKFNPPQVHRYSSFYVARVWNMYRVSRLIVQSIMLRAISWLPTSSAKAAERNTIERNSQDLVDGICASVPYLFGRRLAGMKAPTSTKSDSRATALHPESGNETDNVPTRTGRFSLIWPIYVACSASFISEEQRSWMRAQLQLIADCGEPQAQFALSMESRMLTGGTEHFRFDCV